MNNTRSPRRKAGSPGRGEATPWVCRERSGRVLGKGMLRELPLWGLEKPLGTGEAVPRESSPSDTLFFSGSSGGGGASPL